MAASGGDDAGACHAADEAMAEMAEEPAQTSTTPLRGGDKIVTDSNP